VRKLRKKLQKNCPETAEKMLRKLLQNYLKISLRNARPRVALAPSVRGFAAEPLACRSRNFAKRIDLAGRRRAPARREPGEEASGDGPQSQLFRHTAVRVEKLFDSAFARFSVSASRRLIGSVRVRQG
jgi:hypothetical protein